MNLQGWRRADRDLTMMNLAAARLSIVVAVEGSDTRVFSMEADSIRMQQVSAGSGHVPLRHMSEQELVWVGGHMQQIMGFRFRMSDQNLLVRLFDRLEAGACGVSELCLLEELSRRNSSRCVADAKQASMCKRLLRPNLQSCEALIDHHREHRMARTAATRSRVVVTALTLLLCLVCYIVTHQDIIIAC